MPQGSGDLLDRIVGIDSVILELAVERGAADAELAGHLAHLAVIVTQREADQLLLDLGERGRTSPPHRSTGWRPAPCRAPFPEAPSAKPASARWPGYGSPARREKSGKTWPMSPSPWRDPAPRRSSQPDPDPDRRRCSPAPGAAICGKSSTVRTGLLASTTARKIVFLELADVAGPVIGGQQGKRRGRELRHLVELLFGGAKRSTKGGENRNVLLALPERRNGDREDIQPVIEILAELACLDGGNQVLVGAEISRTLTFCGGGHRSSRSRRAGRRAGA